MKKQPFLKEEKLRKLHLDMQENQRNDICDPHNGEKGNP